MNPTRREALLLAGCTLTTSLSGCQVPLLSDRPGVDIEVRNYTSDPQQVKIEVLRTDKRSHSEAEVFSRGFDVPAPTEDESAGSVRREDIVERRPYVVRAQPKFGSGQWHHHHYYPSETTTDEGNAHFDVRLYRRKNSDEVYPRFF